MVREIVKDLEALKVPLKTATKADMHIVTDLLHTAEFHQENCLGLAANQIGYDKRIIVVKMGEGFVPFINPVITLKSKRTYMSCEGCLSLEGTKEVKRHNGIRLTWLDKNFKSHSEIFTGMTAIIIQHEVDHCNGKLI